VGDMISEVGVDEAGRKKVSFKYNAAQTVMPTCYSLKSCLP
jgi:hypothetical protein